MFKISKLVPSLVIAYGEDACRTDQRQLPVLKVDTRGSSQYLTAVFCGSWQYLRVVLWLQQAPLAAALSQLAPEEQAKFVQAQLAMAKQMGLAGGSGGVPGGFPGGVSGGFPGGFPGGVSGGPFGSAMSAEEQKNFFQSLSSAPRAD